MGFIVDVFKMYEKYLENTTSVFNFYIQQFFYLECGNKLLVRFLQYITGSAVGQMKK